MKSLKILILEESKIDTALIIDELKQGGFDSFSKRVDTAETMKLALLEQPWDVIVSDYSMSRFSALAAMAVLQQSGLDIPFIIVSGSIGEDIAVEALKKGANDYLMKGNLARLVPAIERETREVQERKACKQVEDAFTQEEEKVKSLTLELEQRVRERTEQLEQVNKELESFSYSVSHDLQAPVRNLLSLCKKVIARYGNQLDEEGNTFLEYIMDSSQQINLLINDLLNLSRVSQNTLRLKPINLSEMVQDIIRNLRARDPERQVEVNITDGISVLGDAPLLKIALQNLLENAWKFTSKISKPSIIFGEIPYQDKKAYFVKDNGVGFDPAYQEKLFIAFQRLHGIDEYPGSGIGLATVQRIIHRHGGKVWAEGNIDHGACFYFTLSDNLQEKLTVSSEDSLSIPS